MHSVSAVPPAGAVSRSIPLHSSKSSSTVTLSQRYFSSHSLASAFSTQYTLLKELGSGGFGFVCSAYSHVTGNPVAVKFIFKAKVPQGAWMWDDVYGQVPAEVYHLRRIDHPNIVKFVDYFEDRNLCYLLSELHGSEWSVPEQKEVHLPESCIIHGLPSPTASQSELPLLPPSPADYLALSPSMDLFECIEQHDSLSEGDARYIFKQILDAVIYLHSRGLVHRDIKDENILIDSNFHVKIIDFGSCSTFDQDTRFDRFLGTIQYASPEILAARPFDGPSAEVWALGCCLYIMLNGQVPFSNARQAMSLPMNRPKSPLSPACIDLLLTMLQKDPRQRPSVADLAGHSWFTSDL